MFNFQPNKNTNGRRAWLMEILNETFFIINMLCWYLPLHICIYRISAKDEQMPLQMPDLINDTSLPQI